MNQQPNLHACKQNNQLPLRNERPKTLTTQLSSTYSQRIPTQPPLYTYYWKYTSLTCQVDQSFPGVTHPPTNCPPSLIISLHHSSPLTSRMPPTSSPHLQNTYTATTRYNPSHHRCQISLHQHTPWRVATWRGHKGNIGSSYPPHTQYPATTTNLCTENPGIHLQNTTVSHSTANTTANTTHCNGHPNGTFLCKSLYGLTGKTSSWNCPPTNPTPLLETLHRRHLHDLAA